MTNPSMRAAAALLNQPPTPARYVPATERAPTGVTQGTKVALAAEGMRITSDGKIFAHDGKQTNVRR
jgi:hypothetical protein